MPKGLDIDHIARLARLSLSPEERERYAAQLGQVLGHFAALAAMGPGLADAGLRAPVPDASLRADQPGQPLSPAEFLRTAPAARDGQVAVPRVVDDAS
jgi:aspartyl-tRNA(Asn)/glutamyl-tRNA(Gln) amidotransferase subunit C